MKQRISLVLLDEKQVLDLICEVNGLDRGKASISMSYLKNDANTIASWIIQAQAPELKKQKLNTKLCGKQN